MAYKYKPYLISTDFDKDPELIDTYRWVAGAAVDLGDANGPRYPDKRSRLVKKIDKALFGFGSESGDPRSLNCMFTFFVCSREFYDNPTNPYKKYARIMLIQETYDPAAAAEWLQQKVTAIGAVDEDALNEILHTFLKSDEWDFKLDTKVEP